MKPTVRDLLPVADLAPLVERDAVPAAGTDPGVCVGRRGEPLRHGNGVRVRARVGLRRAQPEHVVVGRGQPERARDRVADPDQLPDDARGHDAEVAAERHELAQLVLREDRVGLALRVLEDTAPLGGDDRRGVRGRRAGPGRSSGPVPPGSIARTSRKHEVAPGSWWPRDRSPSRSARPRRAMSGRVAIMPARAAPAAAPGSRSRRPALARGLDDARRPPDGARRRSSCRPGGSGRAARGPPPRHRARWRGRPRSSESRPTIAIPASMNAVP